MTQNYSAGSFLAGIAIGVGVGMLLASSSAAQVREYFRGRAKDWTDRAEDFVDEGKNYLQRQGRRTGETVDATRNNYDERGHS